jgi:phospholipid/cholesterol/gamma-HCH transport system ATP-binding protein
MDALRLQNICFSHERMVPVKPRFDGKPLRGWLWRKLEGMNLPQAMRKKEEHRILDRASLVLPTKDENTRETGILCIGGPSGQGKSTLLRIVAGLEPKARGELKIFDEPVDRFDPLSISRMGVGFVFQDCALLSNLTIYENLATPLRYQQYGEKAIREQVNRYLKMMLILEFRDAYPSMLSLGMRRRAAVARSCALGSRILLLDEPTAGLDADNRRTLLSLIGNMSKLDNISMLIVTHDFRIAHDLNCKIVFLKDRRLTAAMTYDEAKESPDPYIQELMQGQ